MQVRPARPEEADEIARQYTRMAEEGWIAGEPPVDLAERTERFRASIDAGTTFVLEIDGRLAGFGGVNTTHARGVVTFGMAVMPEARGTGGGRALLDRIVDYARRQGCHKIEVEGLRRDHYRRKDGSLRSALVMAKRL